MLKCKWRVIILSKVDKSIHDYYEFDTWVESVKQNEDGSQILIEFSGESIGQTGYRFHKWLIINDRWALVSKY